jgi:hypothetical protein
VQLYGKVAQPIVPEIVTSIPIETGVADGKGREEDGLGTDGEHAVTTGKNRTAKAHHRRL